MNRNVLLQRQYSQASLARQKQRVRMVQSLVPASTRGRVHYVEKPANGEDLYAYLYDLPEDRPATNIVRTEREIRVEDLRPHAKDFKLSTNGVELHNLRVPSDIDWDNEDEASRFKQVKERYYPLAEALLRETTGASRVQVFDHTLRNGRMTTENQKNVNFRQPNKPVGMVHVDYTAAGGLRRLQALLPDEAEKLQQTPFAVVQVWRPLRGPVESSPLGVIDAATVDKTDLLTYRLEFPGRTGFNYGVQHNPNHKWYYTDGMTADEAYVFVCYDSRRDRARFTPHTGFVDLASAPDAAPRESIELRSLCFFENEAPQPVATEL